MLTPFGKALRKLRLDLAISLKDMAAKLNVSSSFLSAVETGKKKIPQNFLEKIITSYKLSRKNVWELSEAKYESELTFIITAKNVLEKKLIIKYIEYLNHISDQEKQKELKKTTKKEAVKLLGFDEMNDSKNKEWNNIEQRVIDKLSKKTGNNILNAFKK